MSCTDRFPVCKYQTLRYVYVLTHKIMYTLSQTFSFMKEKGRGGESPLVY